jgi:hypothetical protein
MRARLYAARFVSAANPGAEVPPTPPLSYFAAVDLQVNRAAARDLYPVPACGCGVLLALRRPPARPRTADPASASGRCADSVYNFPVHAPNRTQHAPSISYRCRSRRSICRIGYSRAYPAVHRAGNQIHRRCAVPGTIRGRAGCLTNDQYGADTTADCMADVAVSARRSLGNKLELCLERVAHLRLELRVRRER